MITEIQITGQIFGNSKLRNAIIDHNCTEHYGMFNSYILTFATKKAAINALAQGYQSFCREMPEEKNKFSGFKYLRGHSLSWDASRAVIINNKK